MFIYPFRLPFDPDTPFGYAGLWMLQIISYTIMCHVAMCALSIMIGLFGIMMAFAQGIQKNLNDLSENYKIDKNYAKILDELQFVVQFHSVVKELSNLRLYFDQCVLNNNSVFISDWSMNLPGYLSLQ